MVLPSKRGRGRPSSSATVTCVVSLALAVSMLLLFWEHHTVNDRERMLSVEWHTHNLRHFADTPNAAIESIQLTYAKPPSGRFERNRFTLDDFIVNGVNLAQYGMEQVHHKHPTVTLHQRYELFDNFDIEDLITGQEHWTDLVHYHRDLEHRSLIFYMDKVSQKRWMKAAGIPMPKALVLKYRHELLPSNHHQQQDTTKEEEETAVTSLLPEQASYVAKPTHKSSSSGVWLVRYDPETQQQYMGYSGAETKDDMDKTAIAHRVVKDLHLTAADFESWALLHAQPGFVVEERFSAQDSDLKAAYEFKTFTIWGKVYMAYLKRGAGDYVGLVYRNGTMIKDIEEDNCEWTTIPEWLMFDQVVAMAEHLGRNKDMFRADIFVGIPSSSLIHGGKHSNDNAKVQIAVSETEFHPTSAFHEPELLEEAARLWMAGYQMGIHTLIPNDEVPRAFLENGYLSEKDAAIMKLRKGDKWSSKS